MSAAFKVGVLYGACSGRVNAVKAIGVATWVARGGLLSSMTVVLIESVGRVICTGPRQRAKEWMSNPGGAC